MKRLTILAFLALVATVLLVLPATSTHSASHLFTGMNEVEDIIDDLAGTLEVTKEVDWGTHPVDEQQVFEICINGPSYPDDDCQVVGYEGGTLSWENLIPGEYTIEETDPGDNWNVAISVESQSESEMVPLEGPLMVPPKETRLVIVQNSIAVAPPQKLRLDSVCSNTQNEQTARWRVSNPNPFAVDFTYVISGTDETGSMSIAAEGETFFETDNLGTARIFVGDTLNDTQAMRTECGVIEVTKVVRWEAIQPHPRQTFTLCLTRGENGQPDCKTVGYSGGVLRWTGLFFDEYTITEVDPGSPWIVEGAPQTVVVDSNEPVEAQVTNRNTCEVGDPVCDTGGEIELTEYEVIITPEEGGTLTIKNFTITFPPQAVPEAVRLVFKIPEDPPAGLEPWQYALDHFVLEAYALSDGGEISQFLRDYIISMTYVAEEVMERIQDVPTLYLAYANEQGEWVVMESVVDPDRAVVITRSDHFTEFALIVVAAPAPTPDKNTDATAEPTSTPQQDRDKDVTAEPTSTPEQDGDATTEPTSTPQQHRDEDVTVEPTPTPEQDRDEDVTTEPTSTPQQDADDEDVTAEPAPRPAPKPDQDDEATPEPAPTQPDDIAPEAEPEPDTETTPEPSQQRYQVYLPMVRN